METEGERKEYVDIGIRISCPSEFDILHFKTLFSTDSFSTTHLQNKIFCTFSKK